MTSLANISYTYMYEVGDTVLPAKVCSYKSKVCTVTELSSVDSEKGIQWVRFKTDTGETCAHWNNNIQPATPPINNTPERSTNSMNTSLVNQAKLLALNADDKALYEAGITDINGVYTSQGYDLVQNQGTDLYAQIKPLLVTLAEALLAAKAAKEATTTK